MNPEYLLKDPSQVFSPGLLFYKTLIARNIQNLVKRVGNPARLRPHVKTHKTRQIARMELRQDVPDAFAADLSMVAQLPPDRAAQFAVRHVHQSQKPLVGILDERFGGNGIVAGFVR